MKLYSEKDVELLAEYILNNWENPNSQSRGLCNYCYGGEFKKGVANSPGGRTGNYDEYNHKPNCLVFVAQDILTP